MIIRQILFSFLIFLSFFANGKEYKYKVSDIPEDLKYNAKAVLRQDVTEFTIHSSSSASLHMEYAITIMNENGIDLAYFYQFYDKFSRISNIKGTVYDANGEKVKSIKQDEILDYSAISGYSIYEDNRVKYIDPEYRTYPFTVEYSCDISYNGILFFPPWGIYPDYNVSVEKTSYTAKIPLDYELRYKEYNLTSKVKTVNDGKITIHKWDTANLKAIAHEPYGVSFWDYSPWVYFAPTKFEMEGISGDCSTWKDFGIWINKLNEGRAEIPPMTQIIIKQLIDTITNDFDKVKAIYQYVQNKTRYVSIQVGIGGFQPFDASTVDKLSYGDCKALSNYTKALLEFAGIKCHYALIRAGSTARDLVTDFPCSQFNHAIVCVPLENDTIWLECTDQKGPCGFIGTFTDDRDVLLITENGGQIVHTKVYGKNDNQKINNLKILLNEDGSCKVSVHTAYKGFFYDEVRGILSSDDIDKKKKITNRIHIPNFKLISFSHDVLKEIYPVVDEYIELEAANYASKLGNNLLFVPNIYNRQNEIPKTIKDRKSDIQIRRSFIETDTFAYTIPQGYILAQLPEAASIQSPFGEYASSVQKTDEGLIYIRSFGLNKGRYPKESYAEFRQFLEDINTADNKKIVITKQE